jgi:cytochrome c oxidase subunit 3
MKLTVSNKSTTTHVHPFHIVDPSPWPFVASFGALCLTFGAVLYIHSYAGGGRLFFLGICLVLLVIYLWWRDIVREGTFEGQHTSVVQQGLRIGIILFIVSEVIFFVAFFWAFFHSSLSPVFQIGGVWPPEAIQVINPWEIPLLNTVILLSSGCTVTWAHHALVAGAKKSGIIGIAVTIGLAVIFTALQLIEYKTAPFSISDGIYGSVFYLATGFHGFHVLIGTIFLTICALRWQANHFSRQHHFGFEAAAWYWHFVDVVWLFLFISIYWWGS